MKRLFSAGIVVYRLDCSQDPCKRLYILLHYQAGHWDFPKGQIEKGETKEQAALRELEEETGLTADIVSGFQDTFVYWFRGYKKGELTHKTVYFFVGKTDQKKVTLSDEHIGYEWLAYEQALEKLTHKNAKELLKNVEAFLQEKA